jgi:hypothetical protein
MSHSSKRPITERIFRRISLECESSNIGLVILKTTGKCYADQANIAWFTTYKVGQLFFACRKSKTTKPILFDSLLITAAIYSESSNIGLVD